MGEGEGETIGTHAAGRSRKGRKAPRLQSQVGMTEVWNLHPWLCDFGQVTEPAEPQLAQLENRFRDTTSCSENQIREVRQLAQCPSGPHLMG